MLLRTSYANPWVGVTANLKSHPVPRDLVAFYFLSKYFCRALLLGIFCIKNAHISLREVWAVWFDCSVPTFELIGVMALLEPVQNLGHQRR